MSYFEEVVNETIGEVMLKEAPFRAETLAQHIAELVRERQGAGWAQCCGGKLSSERAAKAVERLAESPVRRVPTIGLIADAWALRANISAYDACYVALARALDCPLLSTDVPLRRSPLHGVRLLALD